MPPEVAELYMVRKMDKTAEPVSKWPFQSVTMLGLAILIFEIGDLLTGDPLSLNGAFKVGRWLLPLGAGLVAWGRSKAIKPLKWL